MHQEFQSRTIGERLPPGGGLYRPAAIREGSWRSLLKRHAWFSKGWRYWAKRGGAALIGFGVAYILFLWITLPDIDDPRSLLIKQSSVITDRNGIELYRLHAEEDRTFIDGKLIPDDMRHALISIEDKRFFDRGCLDIAALARVVLLFGQRGGASTITRQLARNALHLNRDALINRKVKEIILGCSLERRYTKNELLDLYLNWIPFGENAYGIEQASQVYFGKSASGLTLAQSAILAALPQRPSYFSPYGAHRETSVDDTVDQGVIDGSIRKASQIPEGSVTIGLLGTVVGTGSTTLYVGGRTDQVLFDMQEQGYITEQERLAALAEIASIRFQPGRQNIRAAHFVIWVRELLEELFAGGFEEGFLEQGGLRIETTIDWELQKIAEDVMAKHRETMASLYGAQNGALVAIDPETREILAYVGNTNFSDEEHGGKIDMARVPRQPGSSFKPFVYATAFRQGYGPATVLWDVPTKIGGDQPQNFDGTFWGPITIRRALGGSRNIPAAKAYFLAGGEDAILDLASQMGVTTPLRLKRERKEKGETFDYGWPLALGAAETPLLEMIEGYAVFADQGRAKPLSAVRRITDAQGNIRYEAESSEGKQVLDPRIAYQITSILSDVSVRPNPFWQSQLSVTGFSAAAKTGTSNKCLEWKDTTAGSRTCLLRKPDNGWVLGYTPSLLAGVWVGNADSSAMYPKGDGLNTGGPLWKEFMERAHRVIGESKTTFQQPPGLVQPLVSLLSGKLPTDCTPVELRKADLFLSEAAPSEEDTACVTLTVDKVTGLLSSDACPIEAREQRSFFSAHDLLPERWPNWEQGVREWVAKQMEIWRKDPLYHSGSLLPLPAAPVESCDPSLTPGRLIKPSLTVIAPEDGGTVSYPSFKPSLRISVGSSIREVRYAIDGKDIASAAAEPFEIPLRVPRSIAKDGRHTLEVTLVDAYYNQAEESVSFSFGEDKIPPDLSFVLPRGDITLPKGGTLSIQATASDRDGGLKMVQFFLGETLLSNDPTEPFELTYTLREEPGRYVLRAVATDLAENTAEVSLELRIE